MLRTEKIKIIFITVIFFSLFLLPRINNIDYSSLLIAFLGLIALVIRLKDKFFKIDNFEIFSTFLLIIVFINTLVFSNYKISEDWYYFLRITRSYFLFYIIYILTIKFQINQKNTFRLFWSVGLIHILLVLFQYFSIGNLKLFFLSLNPVYNEYINPSEYLNVLVGGLRVKGIMMGFDGAGILIAIWSALSIYLFKNKFLKLSFLVIGLGVSFLTSRTGILLTGIVFSIYIFFLIKQKSIVLISLVILLISSTCTLVFKYSDKNSALITKTMPFMLEGLVEYKKSGQFKIASLQDTLFNHSNVPISDFSLFGKPEKQKPSPDNIIKSATQSDIGYIQLIGNVGVIGMIIVLIALGREVFLSYKESKTLFDCRIILIFLILIANIKGPYFFGRLIFDILIILFAFRVFKESEKESYIL